MLDIDERAYFQRRLRDEVARCARFHAVFDLVILESVPGPGYVPGWRQTRTAARLLERRLRASDIVAAVYEDTIAIMLVGTGAADLRDAEHRIRDAVSHFAGSWRLTEWTYPEHASAIAALELAAT